jgi:hypothetical protein
LGHKFKMNQSFADLNGLRSDNSPGSDGS